MVNIQLRPLNKTIGCSKLRSAVPSAVDFDHQQLMGRGTFLDARLDQDSDGGITATEFEAGKDEGKGVGPEVLLSLFSCFF